MSSSDAQETNPSPIHAVTNIINKSSANPPKLRVNYDVLSGVFNVLRVNKWDAIFLDSEILEFIKPKVRNMFALFDPGTIDRIKPEIELGIACLFFLSSTGWKRPTPGMKLKNIQYPKHLLSRCRTITFFILTIALPYAWKKLYRYFYTNRVIRHNQNAQRNETVVFNRTSENLSRHERMQQVAFLLLKHAESVVIAGQLVNLLLFLRYGTYRSLSERCLKLKLENIPVTTESSSSVNYDYVIRQIFWDGLMKFGNFIVPFIAWRQQQHRRSTSSDNRNDLPCSLCTTSFAKNPYITSCGHIYCYYCLQTSVASNAKFKCSTCGEYFKSSSPM